MRCESCLTQCLDTDSHCLHCRRKLVGEEPVGQRSATRVFGLVFAAIGATTAMLTPAAAGLNANRLAIAAAGAVSGWILGMAVGLLLERVVKKSRAEAVIVEAGSLVRPVTRR